MPIDYKNLPQGTISPGRNQRYDSRAAWERATPGINRPVVGKDANGDLTFDGITPRRPGSQGINYGPAGVPNIPGSPLRREPNLDMFQQPLYEGGMDALRQMLSGGGRGGRDLIGQGEGVLSQLLGGIDPAESEAMFREKYLPSQRRTFQEETLPGIRESMASAGDFWSTGRANLETKAQNMFAERMEAQLADLQREGRQSSQQALNQLGDVSGMRQRQDLQRIQSILPFLNLPTQTSYLEPKRDRISGSGGGRRVSGGGDSGRMISGGGNIPGLKIKMPSSIKRWGQETGRPRMMM